MKDTQNPRLLAVHIIQEVINGHALTDSLAHIGPLTDQRDRAFLRALCYGICRWFWRLNAIASQLLKKPFKTRDQDIQVLILVGLYQLMDMRVPAHAAIYETVAVLVLLKKEWAKGVVNGVLRAFQRRLSSEISPSLRAQPLYPDWSEEAIYSHPQWLIDKLKQDWPEHWQSILTANNQLPPFSLRINQQHCSREQYLALLSMQDLVAFSIPETPYGIIMAEPMEAIQLPGFQRGDVSVQDGAAQLAVTLLELASGQRVLDACAAPGGKTAAMLETMPDIALTAVEYDSQRIAMLRENLSRLQLQANCICGDVGAVTTWWDGLLFDRILLDAPCSGSGVIRRHPDIKLLRRESDISAAVQQQWRLLESVWPLLQPGGIFLYATCAIFLEENVQLIEKFLALHSDAYEEKIAVSWGMPCVVGRQILPGMHEMDGFYYARLRKRGIFYAY